MNGAGGHDGDPVASYQPNDKGHVAMGTAVFDTVIGGTPFSR